MKDSSAFIPEKHRFFLKKEERLNSRKQIEHLFSGGETFNIYPIKVIYRDSDYPGDFPAKVAFAVSKKLFKKAVDRNLIKRRMREAYRLNKQILLSDDKYSKKDIFFIYTGREITGFANIENSMKHCLSRLLKIKIPNP